MWGFVATIPDELRRQPKHITLSPAAALVRYSIEFALRIPGQAAGGNLPIASASKGVQGGFLPGLDRSYKLCPIQILRHRQ
jgi:hypothetical protein